MLSFMHSSLPSAAPKRMLLVPIAMHLAPGEEMVLLQCSLVVSKPAVSVLASPG